MKTKLFTLILAINVFAMMANAELLGNGRLRSIKEKQGYLNQSLESRNTQIKSQQTYNSVIDLTFGANDSVTWVDLTSSDGWWQIVAENETCVISLSNSNVVSQAAGTYTAANLEEDYSYIAIKAPTGYIQEYIRFASGSITVTVDSNDNVIVIGSLVGEDGNTYNISIIGSSNITRSGTCGIGLNWVLSNNILTISGNGDMNNYSYNSSPWKEFEYAIHAIVIENGCTSIGKYAFNNCQHCVTLTISNSVTRIREHAFEGCIRLTSLTIPNGVIGILDQAFSDCTGLNSISIPNSVTGIGAQAFSGCTGLDSVTFDTNVDLIISDYAFYGCTSLTKVNVMDIAAWCNVTFYESESSNPLYYAKHLYLNNIEVIDLIIPSGVTEIRDAAFYNCSALTSVTIPNGVKWIGNSAFYNCSGLTSVTIPNGVKWIGNSAFYNCSGLTSVTIPNSVTSIYNSAFYNCSGLASVTIPNSVTKIYDECFAGCNGLSTVSIGTGVKDIGHTIFKDCSALTSIKWNAKSCNDFTGESNPFSIERNITSFILGEEVEHIPSFLCRNMILLTTINIPTGVQSIGENTFEGCTNINSVIWDARSCDDFTSNATPFYTYNNYNSTYNFDLRPQITSFTFGENVERIPNYLCSEMTNLKSIKLPDQVQTIGEYAFNNCSGIESLTFGKGLTSIERYAFKGLNSRKLNTLSLPANITSIGDRAFDGCSYLETIDFGLSLESIGSYAFNSCTRVATMTCLAEITPEVGNNGLTSISSQAKLYILKNSLQRYQLDENWKRFDIEPYGANDVTCSDNHVTVSADDYTATFVWPTDSVADCYKLVIKKDGEVICTLLFNGTGQLTGISFAPSREETPHAPAATMSIAGMSFTVTGLNAASKYAYRLSVMDNLQNEIQAYSGEFATIGYAGEVNPGGEPEITPEGLGDIRSTEKSTKILRNGQILILRGEKVYTVTGQEVR